MSERTVCVVGMHFAADCQPVVIALEGVSPHVWVPGLTECPIPAVPWAWGRPCRGTAYLAWHILATFFEPALATELWADYASNVLAQCDPRCFVATRESVERFVLGFIASLPPSIALAEDIDGRCN